MTNTITVALTNRIDNALYHNWVYTVSGAGTVRIDLSLDSVSWVPLSTNILAANAVVSTTTIGKWGYYRLAFAGTNMIFTVEYMGGR